MDQSKVDAIAEINTKVALWKNFFHQELNHQDNGAQLSYVDILKTNSDLTIPHMAKLISEGISVIGTFSNNASAIMRTPEKQEIQSLREFVAHEYDNTAYHQKQAQSGAIIASPPDFPGQRFGLVFHDKPFCMVEYFYETENELLLKLPDAFTLDHFGFCTIKAVDNLEQHPELKKTIDKMQF